MNVIETDRLVLRHLTADDAAFILALTNDSSWVQFIGDIGVRTLEDANAYILRGPTPMYAREGFGLYLTALKDDGIPIGICGLIKRASLDDVDIGFVFLPSFGRKAYAYEAASATIVHGRQVLGLQRIVAITTSENSAFGSSTRKAGSAF